MLDKHTNCFALTYENDCFIKKVADPFTVTQTYTDLAEEHGGTSGWLFKKRVQVPPVSPNILQQYVQFEDGVDQHIKYGCFGCLDGT